MSPADSGSSLSPLKARLARDEERLRRRALQALQSVVHAGGQQRVLDYRVGREIGFPNPADRLQELHVHARAVPLRERLAQQARF